MKKLLLAVSILTSMSAVATTIESGAQFAGNVTKEQARAAAELVRIYGYRCDSISAFMPFAFSDGFRLTCNSNRYAYEIKDVGGRWRVDVK